MLAACLLFFSWKPHCIIFYNYPTQFFESCNRSLSLTQTHCHQTFMWKEIVLIQIEKNKCTAHLKHVPGFLPFSQWTVCASKQRAISRCAHNKKPFSIFHYLKQLPLLLLSEWIQTDSTAYRTYLNMCIETTLNAIYRVNYWVHSLLSQYRNTLKIPCIFFLWSFSLFGWKAYRQSGFSFNIANL